MKHFYFAIAITILGLGAAYAYEGFSGVAIASILALMEISLSFDNAIVNASVLRDMHPKWRERFLTWGIVIAVFGMRLVFPIVLVAFVTHLNTLEVLKLAFDDPERYAIYLGQAHSSISAFGGMFLLMVFLDFILDHKRDVYWLGQFERKLAQFGNLRSIEVVFGLLVLLTVQSYSGQAMRSTILVSGISGIIIYVVIHSIARFWYESCSVVNNKTSLKNLGLLSFIYLEILDAAFSFDGVIGAFAITKDIVIIMIGLGIGAFFVRTLTLILVRKQVLQKYIYLEHGAHYALGALAFLMLISIYYPIHEVFIGGIGFVLILLSYISSVRWSYIVSKSKN